MPRIRMLRPEHRQHRRVGPLPDREYRLWVGMISEADDYGRLVCDPEQLRVIIFGYQPSTAAADVEAAIMTLEKVGLIALYTVGGTRYACFPSWGDHQHPKYPAKGRTRSLLLQASRRTPRSIPQPWGSLPPWVVVVIG